MGEREIRWLHGELPALVRAGALTQDAADRLAAHYGPPPEGTASRVALALFGTLGAALVGGGIILLLAHNWDDLSRPLRATVALLPLLAAQAFAAWVIARRRAVAAWTEPAGILLGAAVFAAVALVGQTYHVPGSLGDYLLGCALLVLPAVYLLDVPRLLLAGYIVALAAWAVDERHAAFWLLTAAAVPAFADLVRRRSEWWLLGLATSLALFVAGVALSTHERFWIPFAAGYLALLAVFPGRLADARWPAPFALAGRIGVPILALVLTFDARDWGSAAAADRITAALGALAGAAALATVPGAVRARRWFDAVAGALPVAAAIVWAGDGGHAVVFNLYLLALGLAAIADGLRDLHLARLNFGLAIVALHAAFRFVDRDLSFIERGVGFIVVGLAFVGLNLWLLRRRRESAT